MTCAFRRAAPVAPEFLHFLAYIPWREIYLDLVPPKYLDFFKYVLPHLQKRSTDVHIATCLGFAGELIEANAVTESERMIHLAFILHDCGWSLMSEAEIAASLGVAGLALSEEAAKPKLRHAELGRELARRLLKEYPFDPPLREEEEEMILKAVLYHDRPGELAAMGGVPLPVKVVCDIDHQWSFTHANFWQDTIRKGVDPREYLENLGEDLQKYFVTEPGKQMAGRLLAERGAEVKAWEERVSSR